MLYSTSGATCYRGGGLFKNIIFNRRTFIWFQCFEPFIHTCVKISLPRCCTARIVCVLVICVSSVNAECSIRTSLKSPSISYNTSIFCSLICCCTRCFSRRFCTLTRLIYYNWFSGSGGSCVGFLSQRTSAFLTCLSNLCCIFEYWLCCTL